MLPLSGFQWNRRIDMPRGIADCCGTRVFAFFVTCFSRTLTTQNTKRMIRKQTSRSVPEATLFLLSLRLVSCRLNIRAPFWIACLNYEAKCGTRVDAVNPLDAVVRMICFQPKMDVAKIRHRKEPHHGDAYSS
jgi:hypothetical protein